MARSYLIKPPPVSLVRVRINWTSFVLITRVYMYERGIVRCYLLPEAPLKKMFLDGISA
jgi:hypothetical protein